VASLDISGDVDVDGTLETDALSINGTTVTSTAAELNILDGVTATTAELNYVDGVTSAIQTQIDAKAPIANPTFTGSFTSPGIDDNAAAIAITIDSSENVGIGTTPSAALDVLASANTIPLKIKAATDSANYIEIENSAGNDVGYLGLGAALVSGAAATDLVLRAQAGNLIFTSNGATERMRIDSSGNVGIGTGSPSSFYSTSLVVNVPDEDGITIVSPTTGLGYLMFADGTSGNARFRGFIGYEHDGDLMQFATSGVERLRIDSSGNVGIGTSNPVTELHVDGKILTAGGSAASPALQINDVNSGLFSAGGNTVAFSTDGLERMRINSSGYVGIGTSSPSSGTHSSYQNLVIGETTSATSGLSFKAATSGSSAIFFSDGASPFNRGQMLYDHSDDSLAFSAAGSEAMRIDQNGAVTKPSQPAFLVRPSVSQSNFAINTLLSVAFGSEVFDQGSGFSSNTFTAPVTGKYQLNANLYLLEVDADANYYEMYIQTSNRTYYAIIDPDSFDEDSTYLTMQINVLADLDANDTAAVAIRQSGGAAQTDINPVSYFSGYLVA
jgi:hypothetical protein